MSKAWCMWVVLLAAGPAAAGVEEPNLLAVPVDGANGEEELDTFFQNQGEAIDWKLDAKVTPAAFYPLACGAFTGTYKLNQAANHDGLSWYNDTGTAPTAGELYAIVPANSPVGTTITSVAIVTDPRYAGGAVGFALVAGQTHYTNPAYDVDCTSCVPASPWIMALMYASASTPNAYYLAFEDGSATASSFGNDGDFNDDVFFVTGLSADAGDSACMAATPVCVQQTCSACNGDHGSSATAACPRASAPHCDADGTCVAATATPDAGVADAAGTNPETPDASTMPSKGSGGCTVGGSGAAGWLVALAMLAIARRRRR